MHHVVEGWYFVVRVDVPGVVLCACACVCACVGRVGQAGQGGARVCAWRSARPGVWMRVRQKQHGRSYPFGCGRYAVRLRLSNGPVQCEACAEPEADLECLSRGEVRTRTQRHELEMCSGHCMNRAV